MTALHESGTYANPIALLGIIDTFLVDVLGWTRNMGPTAVAGKSGRRAHYQRTITKHGVSHTLYWNFWASGAAEIQGSSSSEMSNAAKFVGLYAYGSTGYDAGLAWDRQPGYPVSTSTGYGLFSYMMLPLAPGSPLDYYLFGDAYGDAYFLAESAFGTDVCASLYAGVLNKEVAGSYDGGAFFGGSVIPQSQAVVAGATVSQCAWEAPLASGLDSGYYNTTMFVWASVDGITGWVSIQIWHSTTLSLDTKTELLGFGNFAAKNTQYGWYRGYLQGNLGLPGASYPACMSLSPISGVTLPRDFYVAVYRSSKSKASMLGSLPLVRACPIVAIEAVPFGTVLQGVFFSTFMAIELNDA